MNAESILSTGIANIDTVYGGVRGTTLSSRHNLRHWQTIAESGIRTVIELRNEDHSERLCRLCKEYDIYYFPFPLDSHSVPDGVIASGLQALFDIIDKDDFYIGCAMGLHRTDMALSIYWMFHGAEKGLPPPYLKGHFPDTTSTGREYVDPGRIFRRLNSLYNYLSANIFFDIPDRDTFAMRRKMLVEHSKETVSKLSK